MDLAGKFLIARPSIVDPFFKRGVVFIYENSPTGTAGLVINRSQPKYNTHTLLQGRGFNTDHVPVEPLFRGGPVNEKAVVMFHSAGWNSSNTLNVTENYSVSSDDLMIFRYINGETPRHYRFCTGAAIWHPRQIAAEINANQWLISDLPPELVFEEDPRELWDLSVELNARETIDRFF